MDQIQHTSTTLAHATVKTVIMVITLLLLSSCCKIKEQVNIQVESGYLHTPTGQYKFRKVDYRELQAFSNGFRNEDPIPKSYIIAEGDEFTIIAEPWGGVGEWLIYPIDTNSFDNYRDFSVDLKNARYTTSLMNSSEPVKKGSLLSEDSRPRFNDRSRTIKPYMLFYTYGSDTIFDNNSYYKTHTIHYRIPFTTNGQEYLIDVTISLPHSGYLDCDDWGIPGIP